MGSEILFFFEVVVGGLLAGTMYSLVALGFVLIYKASATFNFAQGAMVFFAVLSFVGFMELGLSIFPCFHSYNWTYGHRRPKYRKISYKTFNESKRGYIINGNHRTGICP